MNTVTKQQIDDIMQKSDFVLCKIGLKTTAVCAILPNGFEIVESSACVDPANYDQEVGEIICKERIANRLWQLEGYRLQCDLDKQHTPSSIPSLTPAQQIAEDVANIIQKCGCSAFQAVEIYKLANKGNPL